MVKRIAILGSTGSIGTQALEVIDQHPAIFEVEVLTAMSQANLLISQAIKYKPSHVVIGDESKYEFVRNALSGLNINVHAGAKSLEEVYLAYPGFYAIAVHRLSNQLFKLGVPILPRMMSEFAHSITGADIHPGAEIGGSFFIDHATGIVIGETTIIKDYVQIFQGVTLGGLQVKKSLASTKRHPTIENGVIIYANATILGGDVRIGADSTIGANVCITESIQANSVVTVQSENHIFLKKK